MSLNNPKRRPNSAGSCKKMISIQETRNIQETCLLAAFYIAAISLPWFTLVTPGSTFVAIWLNDVFALLNGVYRVHQGQLPYLDFHTIYGPLVFYVPALGLHLGLQASSIFAFGGVVTAAFIILSAVLMMRTRFSFITTLVVLIFVWLLVVVPIPSGKDFHDITWGTFYNRHGWAAVTVLLLFYVEPRNVTRLGKWTDTATLGLLSIFLLYTKITFGIVGVAFLIANAITGKYNRAVSLGAIAIVAAVLLIVEIKFGFHQEYFANIFSSGQGNSILRSGIGGLVEKVLTHAWIGVACGGALLAVAASGRRSFLDIVYAFGVIATAFALLETTGGTHKGIPSVVAVFVCLGELARRGTRPESTDSMPEPIGPCVPYIFCSFLTFMFVAEPIANSTIAWYKHYAECSDSQIRQIDGLPSVLSGFVVAGNAWQVHEDIGHDDAGHHRLAEIRSYWGKPLPAREYMSTIVEGIELLKKYELKGSRLFVLDNADPFTVALALQPTENGYPLLWAETMLTKQRHPPGEKIFSGVDLIMVPKLPYKPETYTILWGLYGDFIEAEFNESGNSPHWRLLERRR